MNSEMHPVRPPFSSNVVATAAEGEAMDVVDTLDVVDSVEMEEVVAAELAIRVSAPSAKLTVTP